MTIITTTFIPCGAKLPIIALIAGAFFRHSGIAAWGAWMTGIAAIVCSGIILKKTKMFAGEPAPFVMELPAYHMPGAGAVLRSTWERGWSFIRKAGTIILLSTIVLWFFMSFGWVDGSFGMLEAEQLDASILAKTGLIAKENVVATFGMLFGFAGVAEDGAEVWGSLAAVMTPAAAFGFLAFNLLCAPCFAAMGAIRREMNNRKWFWFAIGYQSILAYIAAMCIYQFGTFFAGGAFGIGTAAAVLLAAGILYLLFKPYKAAASRKVNTGKLAKAVK